MSKRKPAPAAKKPAAKSARRSPTPRTRKPAATPEVQPAGVVRDGAATVRHYGDGTAGAIIHASEAAAIEYAASVNGGA